MPYPGEVTLTPFRPLAPARRGVRLAQDLARHEERPALVEDGGVTSYAALAGLVDAATERHLLRVAEPLVLPMRPCSADVVTYLACLAAGRPVLLIDPDGAPGAGELLEARFGARPGSPAPPPALALLVVSSWLVGMKKPRPPEESGANA